MGSVFDRGRAVFASVGVKNYRRFWLGQTGSLIGTWMQITALSWLVLSITGSSGAVGLVVGFQGVPVLLLGPHAGVIVDRFDTWRLMIVLQSAMLSQALLVALWTLTGPVRLWWQVFLLLAALLGVCDAFERPARDVLVREIVGDDLLGNAHSLNTAAANVASLAGPAIAGLLIAAVGEGWCFVVNAATFLGLLIALLRLDRGALESSPVARRAAGQLRDGLRYAAHTPTIAVPLLMTALVCVLAFQLPVSLAPLAEQVLHTGPQGYGLMLAALSFGSVVGGLYIAYKSNTGLRSLAIAASAAAALMLFAALAPTFRVELLALALLGGALSAFFVSGKTTVQLAAPPEMRARVASLYAVAFGSGAIGAPIVGWIISQAGARTGLGVGAATFLVVAGIGMLGIHRTARVAR